MRGLIISNDAVEVTTQQGHDVFCVNHTFYVRVDAANCHCPEFHGITLQQIPWDAFMVDARGKRKYAP